MKIIIDTTVFAHGFSSDTGDVRLLRDLLRRTHVELCIPAIVIEEAANLVRRSIKEADSKLAALRRLTGDDKAYAKLDLNNELGAYKKSVDLLLRDLGARVLPYPTVSHEELAAKAVIHDKPFASDGRGYRDALVWFSLLEVAKSCDEEICFISANTKDFCDDNKDLHSDLTRDLSHNGIGPSRVRFFPSLSQFIQERAILTLPVSTLPTDVTTESPDYPQVLVDGKEWIKTILADALPEFLRSFSRADARIDEFEILALSAPMDIRPDPIRVIDSERRLLQLSAKYRVAIQFLTRKSDLAVWSQRLSIHQREDWDEDRLRVQATMGFRASFHMTERGENTEDFSVASISPEYYGAYEGLGPVAVRLRQTEIHAPNHATWRAVKCEHCGTEYGVGYHRLYPINTEMECIAKLGEILAADHKMNRAHENLYDLTPSPG